MLVLPAKDKNSLAGFVPVLMDNGASWEVHCSRTLDGAILDSYQPSLSELTVGKKGSGLASNLRLVSLRHGLVWQRWHW